MYEDRELDLEDFSDLNQDDYSERNREDRCTVCLKTDLDDFVEPVKTCCQHIFCWPCLYKYVKAIKDYKCPNCRQYVTRVRQLNPGGGSPRSPGQNMVPPCPVGGRCPPLTIYNIL